MKAFIVIGMNVAHCGLADLVGHKDTFLYECLFFYRVLNSYANIVAAHVVSALNIEANA